MKSSIVLCFAAVVSFSGTILAQESLATPPEFKQAVYVHPLQVVGMAGQALIPHSKLGWVQLDGERWVAGDWSATLGFQWLSAKGADNGTHSGSVDFLDFLAGARWYPWGGMKGMYLEPQLNHNRFKLVAEDDKESGTLEVSRTGLSSRVGYVVRAGRWSFDANLGLCLFLPSSPEVYRVKKDGSSPSGYQSLSDALESGPAATYKGSVKFLSSAILPTTNLAVGIQF